MTSPLDPETPNTAIRRLGPRAPDPTEAPGTGLADLPPLCDESEFAMLVADMVSDEAPRLFAIVHEYGVRVDGRIAAWGMAFSDHAEVVSVEYNQRMSLDDPDSARRLLGRGSHIQARLVWVTPAARPADTATP